MTMACKQPKVPRQPTYKGTVVCPVCDAEYDPTLKWSWGYNANKGTTLPPSIRVLGDIDPALCPICRTPRLGE